MPQIFKKLTVLLMALLLPMVFIITGERQALAFTDITENTPNQEAIDFLTEKGIVSGYPDGTFKPDDTLNRAELLKIIIGATTKEQISAEQYKNCFPDVGDEWFAKYVCYAKEKGIISGYADGTFRPAQKVNFVEGLKMQLKAFGYAYPESDPWYKSAVDAASADRLIPFDIVSFGQELKRVQMAEMITRGIKKQSGDLDIYLRNAGNCNATYESIGKGDNITTNCLAPITVDFLKLEKEKYVSKRKIMYVGRNLDKLNLSYEGIENIQGLQLLPNLTALDLGGNEIQNVSFLASLSKLEELDLRDNWLWNLEPLGNLTNLKKLNLNLNITGDPAPLAKLTNLEWLGLYKADALYHIDFLDNLKNLKYVDLGEATVLDNETDTFTKNNPNIKVSIASRPFIGRKADKVSRAICLYFDDSLGLTDAEKKQKTDAIAAEVAEKILTQLKADDSITVDDLRQIANPLVWQKNSSCDQVATVLEPDLRVNATSVEEILKTYPEISLVRRFTYEKIEDLVNTHNVDYNIDLVIDQSKMNFKIMKKEEIDQFIARVSREIFLDLKRAGFTINDPLFTVSEYHESYVTLEYRKLSILNIILTKILRYPEVKGVYENLDAPVPYDI